VPDGIECEAERAATSELVDITEFTSGQAGSIPYVVYYFGCDAVGFDDA
jgi:hypothetical protein